MGVVVGGYLGGGNAIVLDVSQDSTRGRWVGGYHLSFFLGLSAGSLLGGAFTDWLGYRPTMLVGAALTAVGAVLALGLLPETRGYRPRADGAPTGRAEGLGRSTGRSGSNWRRLLRSTALDRLARAGVLQSTFGLLLLMQLGSQIEVAGRVVGVATLTGLGLGVSTLVAMISAPAMGALSDRVGNRWQVAAGGLVPGVLGFGLLGLNLPLATVFGIPLAAVASGSNHGLATALIGDMDDTGRRGRRLGVLFTVGDLASAVGPLLAYALIPVLGIRTCITFSAGCCCCSPSGVAPLRRALGRPAGGRQAGAGFGRRRPEPAGQPAARDPYC